MSKGPISQFIEKHYLHFNSAALEMQQNMKNSNGAKMMVTLGAMSTAEIGRFLQK
jgi:deoxyhypusine synthase